MDETLVQEAKILSEAVETILNPNSDHESRRNAHSVCENFKENSPNCAKVGLSLAKKENNNIIRHFGLQLLENTIKYKWNSLVPSEKVFIKESSMQILLNGTHDILDEQMHIKDVLSRIIVEMIKREWPQQWPSMLTELSELTKVGEVQTELVLMIFLRLAEDVVALQNVQNQRRREIYQSLTSNMNDIFIFFLMQLEERTNSYNKLSQSSEEKDKRQALAHCKVAQSVLICLNGFLEWIPITVVMMNDGMLLQILCNLLFDQNFQLHAAECLLQFVSRKGKTEDREPILILFNQDIINIIFKAARIAAGASLDQHHYLFLKKLCLVLTTLGSQFGCLFGTLDSVRKPSNFTVYLDCLLAFIEHPSLLICKYVQFVWSTYFKHEILSKDEDLLDYIEKIVSSAANKIVKYGLPSRSDHASCEYSTLDFDNDEEFLSFFSTLKHDVMITIRHATVLAPLKTFKIASAWLQTQLSKPYNDGSQDLSTIFSDSFLQWEGTSVFLESVTSKLLEANEPKPSGEDGIKLLKAVLDYNTQDPLILSCALSCISALFLFLTEGSGMLSKVLDKLFSSLVFFLPGQTKATRSRAVKNVRRHACSSLVKICKLYPSLLAPCFDQIYSHVKKLFQDPDQLSRMEKCTLVEALVLIINQFKDFSKQSSFLQEILEPVSQTWLCSEMESAFQNGHSFISFIGLDKEPVEPSDSDQGGMNRSQTLFCLHMIVAVLKRSTWPSDIEEAKRGNFVEMTKGSNYILHNPSKSLIIPLLSNVFNLASALNELWTPEIMKKVSPQFIKAYDMLDTEKNDILGIISTPCLVPTPLTKSPFDRMKLFLSNANESCYHLLGNAGPHLSHAFYSLPNLSQIVIDKVFSNIDALPDYRLRHIIRGFLKPFIQHCSSELFGDVLIPVLAYVCPKMYQRTSKKWTLLAQQAETENKQDDDNREAQELLEDQLTRQLTKEFIDIIVAILLKRGRNIEDNLDQMELEDLNEQKSQNYDNFSDLGMIVLNSKTVLPHVVLFLFSCLTWNDTASCTKCCQICGPVIRQMLEENLISLDDALHIMKYILLGLVKHGKHEASQPMLLNLGLQTYEAFRIRFPDVKNLLLMIPNVNTSDIDNLDEKILLETPTNKAMEKKKKEIFKKIVSEIIEKSFAEMLKKETIIKNLKPIVKAKKQKDDNEEVLLGICSLFGTT